MLTLIKNASVFAPDPLGHADVLVADGRIASVAPGIDVSGSVVDVFDAEGRWLLPGLVDALTHPAGGGGEGGFANRTSEVSFDTFVLAGVTSPVGALGTDSYGRGLDVLYGNVMSLRARGLSAYMYTGSYRVPADTITGDVTRDIVFVEPVIGMGEVAIADHRSSQPTAQELRRIAAETRLGGVISGRGGTVLVHVGDGPDRLGVLRAALAGSDLPARVFYPTHTNRNAELLDEAIAFAKDGASIDFTASTLPEFIEQGEVDVLDAMARAQAAGVPAERITLSSDAGGSLPHYVDGELCGLKAASPGVLLEQVRRAMRENPQSVERVIASVTRNPAAALGLPDVGRVQAGARANLLIIDAQSGALHDVMGNGQWLLRAGELTADYDGM
ncbi:MAG: beta-aspartyl-peptidase [Pseudomonadota bacterium]